MKISIKSYKPDLAPNPDTSVRDLDAKLIAAVLQEHYLMIGTRQQIRHLTDAIVALARAAGAKDTKPLPPEAGLPTNREEVVAHMHAYAEARFPGWEIKIELEDADYATADVRQE
jgi:hypothetical protein